MQFFIFYRMCEGHRVIVFLKNDCGLGAKSEFAHDKYPEEWVSQERVLQTLFKPPKQSSSTHPQFCVYIRLWGWNVMCVHKHSQPSENTNIPQFPHKTPLASCIMIPPRFGISPPWYTSDKCDVCWERCMWFHWLVLRRGLRDWQVYSPRNVKELSLSAAPEPPAGCVLTQTHYLKPE